MAIASITDSGQEPRAWSIGTLSFQFVNYVINSGATGGTVTADKLRVLSHIFVSSAGKYVHTAAPTFVTNVATLAFTVPAETAASLTLGGVTYTATANQGAGGNAITVAYTAGGTAGSEVVTVTGNAISVQIQSGTSTITQVRTAVNASTAAAALVTATGTSATTVSTASATPLASGVTGGARGTMLCIGSK